MMTHIYADIKGEKFVDLMQYLYKKCDTISFFLTDYKLHWTAPYDNNDPDNKDSLYDYEKSIVQKFPVIAENILQRYRDFVYPDHDNDEGYYYAPSRINPYKTFVKVIYKVRFSKSILENFLLKNSNLYDFKYPNLPENLYFYKDDQLIFVSVAHEKLCFFYNQEDNIKKELLQLGLFSEEEMK